MRNCSSLAKQSRRFTPYQSWKLFKKQFSANLPKQHLVTLSQLKMDEMKLKQSLDITSSKIKAIEKSFQTEMQKQKEIRKKEIRVRFLHHNARICTHLRHLSKLSNNNPDSFTSELFAKCQLVGCDSIIIPSIDELKSQRLVCDHVFCSGCLWQVTTSHDSAPQIKCPLCSTLTPLVDITRAWQVWEADDSIQWEGDDDLLVDPNYLPGD